MFIDRKQDCSRGKAKKRIKFCLDEIEKTSFKEKIEHWKDGQDGLSYSPFKSGIPILEEIIGALVAAEIDIEDMEK